MVAGNPHNAAVSDEKEIDGLVAKKMANPMHC
jgi:hypothetical protein